MFKNKLVIPTFVLLFLTAAAIGKTAFGTDKVIPVAEVKASDTAVVTVNDSLYFDSLELSLKRIPNAQPMYSVAKKAIGKWAKLFIAVKIVESVEHLRTLITGMLGEKPTPIIPSDVNEVRIVVSKATEEERDKLIKYFVSIIKNDEEKFGDFDFLEEIKSYNHLDDSIIFMNKIELIKEKKVTTIFNFMQMDENNYFKENDPKKLTCMNFNNETWLMDGNKFIDISQDDLIDIL